MFALKKRDRRSCDQRVLRCSTTELRRCVLANGSCAGGTRTHDTRLLKHVLRIGSRSCALSISFSSSRPFAFVSKASGRCPGRAGRVVAAVCRKRSGCPWVASRKRTASKRRRLCAVRRLHVAGSESLRVHRLVVRCPSSSIGRREVR